MVGDPGRALSEAGFGSLRPTGWSPLGRQAPARTLRQIKLSLPSASSGAADYSMCAQDQIGSLRRIG